MIESLVAASILVVGLLGLFNLIYNSTVRDSEVVHQLQATYLAAEGIEVIKNISDAEVANGNSWNGGFVNGACYHLSYDTNLGSLSQNGTAVLSFATSSTGDGIFATPDDFSVNRLTGSPTVFSRMVCMGTSNAAYMVVTSTVSWSEQGRSESVALSDLLYNWRPQ